VSTQLEILKLIKLFTKCFNKTKKYTFMDDNMIREDIVELEIAVTPYVRTIIARLFFLGRDF
jgi:hypothetical protein